MSTQRSLKYYFKSKSTNTTLKRKRDETDEDVKQLQKKVKMEKQKEENKEKPNEKPNEKSIEQKNNKTIEKTKEKPKEKSKEKPKEIISDSFTAEVKYTNSGKKAGEKPAFNYNNYHPLKDVPIQWETGKPAPFMLLAHFMDEISKTQSRIQKTELLCNCFRSIILKSPEDLLPSIYFFTNSLAPAHEGLELGIGEQTLMKCVAETSGSSLKNIKKMTEQHGDLGTVAMKVKSNVKTLIPPPKLTIRGTFQKFIEIAKASGKNSAKMKMDKIKLLLVSAIGIEMMYLIRSLQAKFRIGLAESTVLSSLAHAIVLTRKKDDEKTLRVTSDDLKDAEEILKGVFHQLPCYNIIVPELLKGGFDNLEKKCHLTPGIPVKPMLAKAAKEVQELFDRFGDQLFTCEYKYDGERAQIHKLENGNIFIYSRNLENHTGKYPDLIEMIPKAIKEGVKDFIIDCEVVAMDKKLKKILPFQTLMTRGRKNITIEKVEIQVCLFAFDLLYFNGKSYLTEPLKERRRVLHENFIEIENDFQFATHMDTKDPEEIQKFLHESVAASCEGLMVKSLEVNATYEPSKRSLNWLKLKKDYLEGMGDSVDLVPIGAYYGKGKRTGVYGGYLLASYDEESETYQSVCKIGSGFSDEMLKTLADQLNEYKIEKPKPYFSYGEAHEPDVWFDAKYVWEVKAADLTISPQHKCAIGIVDPEKGIALRFPRFIRIREDKTPEEATSSSQIVDLFYKQQQQQKIHH